MRYLLKFTLCTLFAFAIGKAAPAKAADGDAALVVNFKAQAQRLPRELMARGYTTFGNLSFTDFMKKMSSIEVIPTGWYARPQTLGTLDGGARSSAQWRRKDGKMQIAVNRKAWALTPAEICPVLALHESLGVMGFNDDNYQISTGLWLLTTDDAHNVMKAPELHVVEKNLKIAGNFSEGGISGVGGGGDFRSILMKMRQLTTHIEDLKAAAAPAARENIINKLLIDLSQQNEITWHTR